MGRLEMLERSDDVLRTLGLKIEGLSQEVDIFEPFEYQTVDFIGNVSGGQSQALSGIRQEVLLNRIECVCRNDGPKKKDSDE